MNLSYKAHIGGGSHLPVLMKALSLTNGPVLELGMGLFSTPYLHWACYDAQRKLLSCENRAEFMDMFIFNDSRELKNKYEYHEFVLVENNNWDAVDLSGNWDVVLVDHAPGPRRKEEIRRLKDSAKYIVVHDTNGRNNWHYQYTDIYPLFKYRFDYTKCYPFTTVLSNVSDVSIDFR